MRYFNYSESENLDGALDFLDKYMTDSLIVYKMYDLEDIIGIKSLALDDNDIFFDKLEKNFDFIEDIDYEDFSDDNYDDFYSDDMEDY